MPLGFGCILPRPLIDPNFGNIWPVIPTHSDEDILQHYAIIRINTIELNLLGGSTLLLHNVRRIPELSRPLILVRQLDKDSIHANFS